MRIRSFSIIATVGAVSSFFLSSAAQATAITYTFTGTVGSDPAYASDGADLFGGGLLVGDSAKLVLTVDTSMGTESDYPTYSTIVGGTNHSATSPVTAALTINSTTYTDFEPFSNTTSSTELAFGSFQYFNIASENNAYLLGQNPGTGINEHDSLTAQVTFPGVPSDYDIPYVYTPGSLSGSFGYTIVDCTASCVLDGSTFLQFDFTSMTAAVSSTSVPEPFTLSIFGAGLIGFAGFYRRKRSGLAAESS